MAQDLKGAILDDYQKIALKSADWSGLDGRIRFEVFDQPIGDADALADQLASFDVIIAMRERTPFDAPLLQRLPKLKLLVTTGMANASIDLEAARRSGVLVCGTGGSVGPAAELAWGLLLALKRNIAVETAHLRAGGEPWQLTVGGDLMGTTLGVVGLGKLGQRMAAYGLAFGMNVVGWSKSNSPERCAALGVAYTASLDDLLERSDVVTLQLRLTEETKGIIGRSQLARMRQHAVLVNTARGPLVDEAALVQALRQNRIAGAALDVFDTEPLPADHPFRSLPNVIATPHLGYVTRETYGIFFGDVVADVAAWLDGRPVRVL